MLYLEIEGGFREWNGEAIDGVRHPVNIEELWPAEDLAKVGLYAPVVPPVPAGKFVTSKRVARVKGVVTFIYTLQDEPVSEQELPALEPWQFWSIVDKTMGEKTLREAVELIPDEDEKIKARRKLAYPPGGIFSRTDPLFSNAFLMMQLQMTAEEIDDLWRAALALT